MKYILLRVDERFGAEYSTIVRKTRKTHKKGDLIPLFLKLYITETKRSFQWVVCKVEDIIENKYYVVKVVKW